MPNVTEPPIRPGIRTTEFWTTLLTVLLLEVGTLYSQHPWAQVAGHIGAALVAAGYGLSRAYVKR